MELSLDALVERFKDCQARCAAATEQHLHSGPAPYGVGWLWSYQADKRRSVLVDKCVAACREMGASCPTSEGIRVHFERAEAREKAAAARLAADAAAYETLKKSQHFTWFGLRPNKPVPGSLDEFRAQKRLERQAAGDDDDDLTPSYYGRGGGSGASGATALAKCETAAQRFVQVFQSVSLRPGHVAFEVTKGKEKDIERMQNTTAMDLLAGAATDVYNAHAAKFGAADLSPDAGKRTATGAALPLPDGAKKFLERKDMLEAGMAGDSDADISQKLRERQHFVNGVHILEGVSEDEFRSMPIREVMRRVQEQGRMHETPGEVHGTRPF